LLEQYPTSAELAASVVLTAADNDDLGPGRTVVDLGCGTGMLLVGSALMDCDWAIGVDCDEEAIAVAKNNVAELELEDRVDFVLGKVNWRGPLGASKSSKGGGSARGNRAPQRRVGRGIPAPTLPPQANEGDLPATDITQDGIPLQANCVDTVLTNPPFGTKHNAGIDVQFLRTATRLARRAVYSFHKSSTRDYLMRKIRDEWGLEARVVAQMRFDIPRTYDFHQKKSVDVDVDLIRVEISAGERQSEC
jgi:putative methylase